jgi:biopolymer transport protein ExbD
MRIPKRRLPPEIFTGSMADVSFLLIIYFMLTMAFSATRGLDFALPEEPQVVKEIQREDAIDVLVRKDGGIQVDGSPLPLEQLLPYIATKLQQNPEKPVILRTEMEATYGQMISVFDELRQAPQKVGVEIKTISIPTRREIESIWSTLGVV